ncbi:MAG: hypothetical protein IIX14_05810 [Clostridia bacterium]|nr:hypothetical protein [Clostridia bacterium]
MDVSTVVNQIKHLLKNISVVSENTQRNDEHLVEIQYADNPLDPNLLAYCFDNILGFDVRYRIFEKVNYIIQFDYKGTFAAVGHFKMSYTLSIDRQYKDEIISTFQQVLPLLEQLFMLIGEQALTNNEFSMKNEAAEYFGKLSFYEKKIESLEKREKIIKEKCRNKYDVTKYSNGCTCFTPKGQEYLHSLSSEITYDIEAYIDTFFSALEHVLTLLYPFVNSSNLVDSYYKNYIRNTRWSWDAKIRDVCGNSMPTGICAELRRIKEVYRNHNAHGGFSREMMAYVQIPKFGRFPIYVGKEYLKGFINCSYDDISYDMYLDAKAVFNQFWKTLDSEFEIPMLFIRSGLAIPIDTSIYTDGIKTKEQAERFIDKTWFDIDNQSNMDW